MYRLRLAVETDEQFVAMFADAAQAGAYVEAVLAGCMAALPPELELQPSWVGTELPVSTDAWLSPDAGLDSADLWQEWHDIAPTLARPECELTWFLSAGITGVDRVQQAGICGALPGLCITPLLRDGAGAPWVQAQTLDLLHNLGHFLGALDSWEFCPPLDDCTPPQWPAVCPVPQECSTQGTIMGACQLCPGGLDRVQPAFHAANLERIAEHLETCVPRHVEHALSLEPWHLAEEAPVLWLEVDAGIAGEPWVEHWAGSEAASFVPMVGEGPWSLELPLDPCGVQRSVRVYWISGACPDPVWPALDQPALRTESRSLRIFAEEDGSDGSGFQSLVGTASAGYWSAGVPVADPAWIWAPTTDAGGDGRCFLTGNFVGNSDVDGGTVELRSYAWSDLQMPCEIDWAWWTGLANQNGADRLVLEVRIDGPDQPWLPVWRASQHGNGSWHQAHLPWQVLQWLGAHDGCRLELRFLARDGLPPSVAEFAVDSIRVWSGGCL
ncbi:MAG: hypothetical protein R3F17_16285 [Planctomycetota bacterium]